MAEANEAAAESTPKPKGRLRNIIVLGGLLIGEAVLIVGAVMLFGGPPEVEGSNLEAMAVPEEEKIVEQLVVEGRFPNSKRGVTYLYDTEIYVQVKRRHQPQVASELDQFRNEIKAALTTVWRTSEPRHFDEPRLESLTRKVYALMNDRFGVDEETGEPVIIKVVIVMGTGLRMDA